jgi:bleomycin hydrolase
MLYPLRRAVVVSWLAMASLGADCVLAPYPDIPAVGRHGGRPLRDTPETQTAVLVEERDAYKAELERRADGKVSTAKIRRVLRPVLDGLDRPTSPGEFKAAWHNPPLCQDLTGQCWAFGATSLLECEVQRSGRKVKLSEAWTFYWEFVEKARVFARRQGACELPRGSEPNAALRVWREHGVVPAEAYTGRPAGRGFYDDRKMYTELSEYLQSLKRQSATAVESSTEPASDNAAADLRVGRGESVAADLRVGRLPHRFSGGGANRTDEGVAIAGVRAILDRYMGPPPETVEVDGVRITPREYFDRVLGMKTDAFVCLMSTMAAPTHAYGQLDVSDNWWGSREYYNLSLAEYARVIREVVRQGGTVCLGIDNTEPGFYYRQDVAVIPRFDIASALIDDAVRHMRIASESTTDDHVVHLVGIQERRPTDRQDASPTEGGRDARPPHRRDAGATPHTDRRDAGATPHPERQDASASKWWYLVKDSDTRPRNGHHNGYMFYDEDYIRLKSLSAMLPRDLVERTLGRALPMPAESRSASRPE